MVAILVVDDRRAIAEGFGGKLVRYARENYQRTVGVEIFCTSDDAVRRITDSALPQLGLIFTDIDLHDGDEPDRAGIAIARYAKSIVPDVPVIGYSGYFGETDLSEEEVSLFDQWWPKSGTYRRLDEMAKDALERAFRHLKMPFGEVIEDSIDKSSLASVATLETPVLDEDFMNLNYIKRVIEPSIGNGINEPFAVWCKQSDEGVEMEVVGISPIFSWGETMQDAESGLVELIQHISSIELGAERKLSERLVEARRFADIATGKRSRGG